MNLDEIKELLRIVDERQFSEFELEREGLKLRVRRSDAPDGAAAAVARSLASGAAPALPEAPAQAAGAGSAPGDGPEDGGLTTVSSPIVGTFYRSPDPSSAAFVNVGDRVSVGQVLCIVEAMKLMNEIEAEIVGEIVKIHVENGQPVQYGDPLFTLRTG